MGAKEFPQLASLKKRHANAIHTNALTGHEQTLEALAEDMTQRLRKPGITEHLVRAALAGGPLTAGQMLLDLVGKGISDAADIAALVEMDRGEGAGGLDFAAIRAAAPQDMLVPA